MIVAEALSLSPIIPLEVDGLLISTVKLSVPSILLSFNTGMLIVVAELSLAMLT